MKAALAACVLLVGCYDTDPLYCQMHGSDTAHCGMGSGSGSGSNAFCYTIDSITLRACPVAPGAETITVMQNTTFDTGTGMSTPAGLACAMLDAGSSDVCLVDGTAITIAPGATLSVTGTKPLVIGAMTNVEIGGKLDVASHRAGLAGPGADAGCAPGVQTAFGGGGAGGSFGTTGGTGGQDANGAGPASTPGAAPGATILRGGCPGTDATNPGNSTGGHGGGAVAVIAGTMITVPGSINASGAGGSGGNASGGAGGGSGGMIALKAAAIMAMGPVFANGGGGGGGTDRNGVDGAAGGDPMGPPDGGTGGTGGTTAGTGGKGYPSATTNGTNGTQGLDGGGGGGGGAGVIISMPMITGAMVSPPSR